jgi:hypothetical protein
MIADGVLDTGAVAGGGAAGGCAANTRLVPKKVMRKTAEGRWRITSIFMKEDPLFSLVLRQMPPSGEEMTGY